MLKPFDIQHIYVYSFLKFIMFSAHHWQNASKNLLSIGKVRLVYFVFKKWGKGWTKLFNHYSTQIDFSSVCHECNGNMKIMSCCKFWMNNNSVFTLTQWKKKLQHENKRPENSLSWSKIQ